MASCTRSSVILVLIRTAGAMVSVSPAADDLEETEGIGLDR